MDLFDWKARRAGGRITITGLNKDGDDAKIVGVDRILPTADAGESGYIWAEDKDGEKHRLMLAPLA
jgi:hypothetical protein